ncbi:MAG: hypothetical protein WBQ94_27610 [Terracidiphilus sp.]
MAARWGEVGHVRIEVTVAGDAVMLGVSDQKAAWPVAEKAADIVQRAAATTVAEAGTATAGAGAPAVVAGAARVEGGGQVFDTRDALGAVGDVCSGWHG